MKNFTRICLHVVASAALAATCAAQGKRTRPARRERPPKRVQQVAVILPNVGKPPETREVGRATLIYYPGQDDTFVFVTLPGIYRQGEVSADLQFAASFKGREFEKQEEVHGNVEWKFISEWDIFREGTPLTVTADGERYSFKFQRGASIPGVHAGAMDFASFRRIANSKSARLGVGRVAFDLTGEQREAMRDLLSVFETTKQ